MALTLGWVTALSFGSWGCGDWPLDASPASWQSELWITVEQLQIVVIDLQGQNLHKAVDQCSVERDGREEGSVKSVQRPDTRSDRR